MASFSDNSDWGCDVEDNEANRWPNDGSDYCGGDGTTAYRVVNKFTISTLPAADTVDQVDFDIYVSSVTGASSVTWILGPYNGTGQGNPETDTISQNWTRSDVSADNYLSGITSYRTTGAKSHTNLGSQANTDVENARDAATLFSISIMSTGDVTSADRCEFAEYTDGTNPPKLTITHSTPTVTATPTTGETDTSGIAPTVTVTTAATESSPVTGTTNLQGVAPTLEIINDISALAGDTDTGGIAPTVDQGQFLNLSPGTGETDTTGIAPAIASIGECDYRYFDNTYWSASLGPPSWDAATEKWVCNTAATNSIDELGTWNVGFRPNSVDVSYEFDTASEIRIYAPLAELLGNATGLSGVGEVNIPLSFGSNDIAALWVIQGDGAQTHKITNICFILEGQTNPSVGDTTTTGQAPTVVSINEITTTPQPGDTDTQGLIPVIDQADIKSVAPSAGVTDTSGIVPTVDAANSTFPQLGVVDTEGNIVTVEIYNDVNPSTGETDTIPGTVPYVENPSLWTYVYPSVGTTALVGYTPGVDTRVWVPDSPAADGWTRASDTSAGWSVMANPSASWSKD